MYEHTCVWKLELNIGYLPQLPSILAFETGSLIKSGPADLARLTGPQPRLSFQPQYIVSKHLPEPLVFFTWVLGNKSFTNQAISQVSFLVFPHLPKQEEIFQLTAAGGLPGILYSYSLTGPEHLKWRKKMQFPPPELKAKPPFLQDEHSCGCREEALSFPSLYSPCEVFSEVISSFSESTAAE